MPASRNSPADSRHRVGAPQHHLAILAVHPDTQGQGTATALLRAYHHILDEDAHAPAYLEASDQRTRQLYVHRYRGPRTPDPPPLRAAHVPHDARTPPPGPGRCHGAVMTHSGDRSSASRKRALRRLAREQRAAYRDLYAGARGRTQTHDQARGQARTLLRYRYPDRYLELYAQERAGPGTNLPPHIRSKAWLKANATLADLLARAYRELFEQMRARGLNNSCAYDMACTQLRHHNAELFADVLTDEIRLCLAETDPPAAPSACQSCGSTSHRPGRDLCPPPCSQAHPRCLACGAVLGQCHWNNARNTTELLTAAQLAAVDAALTAGYRRTSIAEIQTAPPPPGCSPHTHSHDDHQR